MIRVLKELLDKEERYFVAVSMGVDSLAALMWLRWKGYKVTPLHFDHNLRPQNKEMSGRFFQLCEKFNFDGISESGENLKTEAECRKARLNFYSREAAGGKVITAHHLNDWIESYLLNCLRGHPEHTPIKKKSTFPNFTVLHPFLLTRKKDFREFLERNGWMDWVVEDSSNSEIKGSRRNWVRGVILPEMSRQRLSLEKFALRKITKHRDVSSGVRAEDS